MAKASTRRETRRDKQEERRQRRGGIRVAAAYLRDARAANPQASARELRSIVQTEISDDFGDSVEWVEAIMRLVEILLKAWLG